MKRFSFLGLALSLVLPYAAAGQTTSPATQTGTTAEALKAEKWDVSQQGRPLDLAQYRRTFNDDFKTLTVTNDTEDKGPWYAPGHSTFGAAKFMPPGDNGVFTLVEDGLQIRANKDANGKWTSGLMQTVNKQGQGFAQQYGYFEMTAKFPSGKGAWTAFWLLSQNGYTDKTKTRTEIDVIEWYGGDPKGHHATVHLWGRPGNLIPKHAGVSAYAQGVGRHLFEDQLQEGSLPGFHSYGAEVTPQWVITYFDRKEIARIATAEEFKTPLYLLVNLALVEKEAGKAKPPLDMIVKNVSAYLPISPYVEQPNAVSGR